MISVTIDDAEIQAKLKELSKKMGDLSPCMKAIGQMYEDRVIQNFSEESDPNGNKWARLASSTMMSAIAAKNGFKTGKKTKGYLNARGKQKIESKFILFEDGDLRNSIKHTVSKNSVTIGTGLNLKYAAIHQFGGMAGRGKKVKIPARPYLAVNKGTNGLDLSVRDRQAVLGIIEEYLAE